MVGFVYMSEITYFLFNKVPNLTTAIIWIGLLYVLSIYFHRGLYHLFSNACMRFSTFHVHVAVENMHVHNALLNFVICSLP